MKEHRFAHDLVLPTLLFAALGAMTWAVRGCSGFGASAGCLFAGVTWGAAWWFIAREPGGIQTRRYTSGWIIPALALGFAISGGRGWMQWPGFFQGRLMTNFGEGKFVPIPRAYGFLWMFIAGVPWAGLGACMLAWCGSGRPLRAVDWCERIACGIAAAALATVLFDRLPEVFLPLYSSLASQYADFHSNPNLRRLVNDNRAAIQHLGLYLGFLAYEAGRRERKNVILILTVGVVNGAGWAVLQTWSWAPQIWPAAQFNWWRCWESSGGISIGLAYGIAYFLVNRPVSPDEANLEVGRWSSAWPNLERFGAYLGLEVGLGLSIRNGLKGWANIYLGNERYWGHVFSLVIVLLLLLCIGATAVWIRLRPLPKDFRGDVFPRDYRLIWIVLITQNIIAQMVTGPLTEWREAAFSIYYILLFLLSAVIVYHFQKGRAGAACPP